jgi:predicted AAA+ superfamily ATPase
MKRTQKPTWQPSPSDLRQVLTEQNPWLSDGKVPDAWAYKVERPLAQHLWHCLERDEPRRFQLVFGPRRVGKTTVMYQTVRHLLAEPRGKRPLWWLRLDHPLLMELPLGELVKMVLQSAPAKPGEPAFLFLDEITYAREWDLWLKTLYDERWPVRVLGTSSSTAALRDRRMESGVGRWEEQYLAPYLFKEYLELRGRTAHVPTKATLAATLEVCIREPPDTAGLQALRQRFVLTGGFPELLLAGPLANTDDTSILLQSQKILRSDAVERAIYKDIPQAFGVDNPLLLERLLYTLAGQFTGILSPTTICQTLGGLTQPTFDKYLSYLERAFLVFTLPNYSGSEGSVQKRGRKLYFVDGAVRNAALQRGVGPLNNPDEMSLLLENLVAGHLHALSQLSQTRLYHWREKNDEIDLIYDQADAALAFEIGSSATHHRRGIQTFMQRFPRYRGRCYIVAPNAPLQLADTAADQIGSVPLDLLLLMISARAEQELAGRLGV